MRPITLKTVCSAHNAWRRVALLVTAFALPLACDGPPTQPKASIPVRSQSSLLLPSLASAPVYDESRYFPIDMNQAAAVQYCTAYASGGFPPSSNSWVVPGCSAVQVGNGLFGWAAKAPNNPALLPIDVQRAVADQYGAGYVLGAVGVGAYDWRAVHWSALSDAVLPVMVVSEDYFNNVGAVAGAVQNFKSVITSTWRWYAAAMASQGGARETFRPLRPLVVFNQSSYTAAQWNAWSTSQPVSFEDFAWNAFAGAYPYASLGASGASLRVLISVYTGGFTGDNNTVFGGGGVLNGSFGSSVIPAYAVVPPATTSLTCTSDSNGLSQQAPCNQSAYWIGHELGQAFGLQECTAASPGDCQYTIMFPYPPGYVPRIGSPYLMQTQISALASSGFFFNP